jgi:hypothetical protein
MFLEVERRFLRVPLEFHPPSLQLASAPSGQFGSAEHRDHLRALRRLSIADLVRCISLLARTRLDQDGTVRRLSVAAIPQFLSRCLARTAQAS